MKKIKNEKVITKKEKNLCDKGERIIFQRLPKIKERSKKTYLLSFIMVFTILYSGLLGTVLKMLGITTVSTTVKELVNIILLILGMFSLGGILKETLKRDIKDYWTNKKDYLKYGVSSLIVLWFIEIIVNTIMVLIVQEPAINEVKLESTPFLFLLLTAGFLGPVVEEFMFRGLLRKIIKNKYIYLIVSSVFFGAMHMHISANPLQYLYIISYSLSGFIFAYNYEKTDNIVSPIIMHIINNLIFVLL